MYRDQYYMSSERSTKSGSDRAAHEEAIARKAASETQYFWSLVSRNGHQRSASRLPKAQNRAREESYLFGTGTELLKGVISDNIPVQRSGPGAETVPVLSSFADLNELPQFLKRNIRLMRYEQPSPIQKHAVPLGLAGHDLMCCAQTGSGKTFAFLLPVVSSLFAPQFLATPQEREQLGLRPVEELGDLAEGVRTPSVVYNQVDERGCMPKVIILAPTRELASQIHVEAKKLINNSDVKAVVVYGGADIRSQLTELATGCDIVVATPGRLNDLVDRRVVSFSQVSFLVLDEADRMLDMGFEPQIRRIVQENDMPGKEQRQTLMFSATFPDEIQKLATEFLRDYVWVGVGRIGSTVENIEQRLVQATSDPKMKMGLLLEAISSVEGRTLVFVQKKRTAVWVCQSLHNFGVHACEIHGDRTQAQREYALRHFRLGHARVLVATDVAARGLDIPEVTHVVQFDLPISAEDFDTFIHRIGRTGRAGKSGVATSFYVPGTETGEGNGKIAPLIYRTLEENNQEIPPWFEAIGDHLDGGRRSGKSMSSRSAHNSAKYGGRDVRGYQTHQTYSNYNQNPYRSNQGQGPGASSMPMNGNGSIPQNAHMNGGMSGMAGSHGSGAGGHYNKQGYQVIGEGSYQSAGQGQGQGAGYQRRPYTSGPRPGQQDYQQNYQQDYQQNSNPRYRNPQQQQQHQQMGQGGAQMGGSGGGSGYRNQMQDQSSYGMQAVQLPAAPTMGMVQTTGYYDPYTMSYMTPAPAPGQAMQMRAPSGGMNMGMDAMTAQMGQVSIGGQAMAVPVSMVQAQGMDGSMGGQSGGSMPVYMAAPVMQMQGGYDPSYGVQMHAGATPYTPGQGYTPRYGAGAGRGAAGGRGYGGRGAPAGAGQRYPQQYSQNPREDGGAEAHAAGANSST